MKFSEQLWGTGRPSVGQGTAEFDEFGKRPRNGALKGRDHFLRIGVVKRGEVGIAEDAISAHDPVTDRNGKIDELEHIESGFCLKSLRSGWSSPCSASKAASRTNPFENPRWNPSWGRTIGLMNSSSGIALPVPVSRGT